MKKDKQSVNPIKALGKAWAQYSYIFVFLIIMVVYAAVIHMNGNTFKASHISAILASQNTVIVGTMAIGMALVVITGQIDLSIGSALVLVTGCTIMTFNVTNSIPLMLLAALASGAVCGLLNGLMVGAAKMPPFIATMGTMLIYRSATLSFVRELPREISGSGSSQFSMISDNSNFDFLRKVLGTGKMNLGIIEMPYITILFIALLLLFVLIAKRTKYGKAIYAVGSNEKSARLAGINVTWIKISVYVVLGLLVGVASFIQACKIGNITPATSGTSYEMYAIAAIVLGGISMSGGRGNLVGIIFGALSYTTVNFIIVSIPALSTDMQDAFQGLVLILVILIQTLSPILKAKINSMKKRKANKLNAG